ncbi:T9SS type A sorting domain-containing protein, partial [bacterium]|nr:T9SS type A sorting domain-containing protein [bacterium]
SYYDLDAEVILATDMDTSNNQGTAFFDTYTLPHVPLGILLTQSDCPGCAAANQALDAYIPTQGNDVAILRVHVWWPGTDAIYDANEPQNNFMALGSGADYAPHLRIDQKLDAGSDGSGYALRFDIRKGYHSPMNIVHVWDPATETVTVEVENLEYMPPEWNLRLRVAITEDDVYEPGTNGELYHDQAFRYMYPDTDGLVVPTTPGKHRYTVHCPVNAETWVYEKLRAVVYVQDNDTWKVHNAATGLLTETLVAVDDSAPALLTVKGNHPNPFNPETAIKYELSADRRVRLTIYDVDGSLVATLVDGLQTAGAQSAVWDGRDAAGRPVSSGAYFYRIDAGGLSETRKMVMVK